MDWNIKYPKPSQETLDELKYFQSETGLDLKDVMTKCYIQSQEGLNFVAQYRNYLQADFVLYKNTKSQDDRLGDTTLFNKINALIARDYKDSPTVLFDTTDISQKDAVTNLNAVYKEDYEEDDMEVINYYSRWFKYLFGVGIKSKIGWDGVTKRNIFQWVDPRIWVPDPDGDYVTGEYAYTGFEKMYDQAMLFDTGWMNLDKSYPMQFSAYSQQLQKYKDQQLDFLPNLGTNVVMNPWYDIYYHFFKVEDKKGRSRKAMAIYSNDRRNILYIKLLAASCKEEEKNPSIIPFPFSFHYWKPEPNNPFGNRPANYIRDVQKFKALIANLRIKKAKAELYPMYFYNQKYIKNRADLTFGFNKFIAVNTGADGAVPIDSIIRPFAPDSRADNSFKIDESLDQQVDRSTSISENLMGTTSTVPWSETATEQNLIQTNADLNLSLNAKIDNWGEKQFVRLWLRGYLENFADGDKKIISMTTGVGTIPVQLTKRDFIVGLMVKIKVVSKGDIEAKKQAEKLALNVLASFIQASNVPEISKTFMLREMAISNGIDEEKVTAIIPKMPQELIAENENMMLLNDFAVTIKPTDDDVAHLILHNAAGNGVKATLHRMSHIQQYIAKWQPQPQTANQPMQNSMMAQQSSQMAGQQAQTGIPNPVTS